MVAEKMNLVNEMYFAILLDRASGGPVIIACSEGGTSIEDLAEESPEKIVKVPVDPVEGLTDAQAAQVVEGLMVTGDKEAAKEQIHALFRLFDASMLCRACLVLYVVRFLPVVALDPSPRIGASSC